MTTNLSGNPLTRRELLRRVGRLEQVAGIEPFVFDEGSARGVREPLVYAGRDWHTDQGQHTFDFVLHAGSGMEENGLSGAARQWAQPPVVFDRYEGMDRPPWGNSPPRGLWLEAEERAFANGRLPELKDNMEPGAAQPLFARTEQDRQR